MPAVRNVTYSKKLKDKISVIIDATQHGAKNSNASLYIVDDKELILKQIECIQSTFSNSEIIVILGGQDVDKIFNILPNNIICIENDITKETNATKNICIGLKAATSENNVLLLENNILFNESTLRFNYQSSCAIIKEKKEDDLCCIINEGIVESVFFDIPEIKAGWSGIVYLTGKELNLIKNISYNRKNHKLLYFETINNVITAGGKICAAQPKNSEIKEVI